MTPVELTGDTLTSPMSGRWSTEGRTAALGDLGREHARAARALLDEGVGEHTYGVNTGFGRFVSESIPEAQAEELQVRLLRSHACGVGEPYPDEVVRAAMLLRANTLAKGYSGAKIETDRAAGRPHSTRECCHVSLRAAPSVRAAISRHSRTLRSRWSVKARQRSAEKLMAGAAALEAVGLTPVRLASKEGLSLINGTQFMTAMASLILVRAQTADPGGRRRLRHVARGAEGHPDELSSGDPRGASPRRSGRERGEPPSACSKSSAIVESHRWCDKVQDAYSLRCAPQVHGASRDLLDYVARTVDVEVNAATDNPLVLVAEGQIVSNGNFHGQPIAMGLDCMSIACAELASISERRTERLVNPSLSDGLPPFLVTREEGLNSGFMILQYVAAALVSENKSLCHPASVDSIPTSAGQEDHVSMGNGAGLKALQVIDNAEHVLAIELLAGTQAVEFLAPLEPGVGVRDAHGFVRTLSERVREDRPLSADIELVADAIRDGSFLLAVEARVGALA